MHYHQDSEQFTVLENRRIGRNIALYRKLKDKKAMEVAEYIGIGEAAYTKYERGETKMTIDIIQKVSEFLKVNPMSLIAIAPTNYIESLDSNNATVAQTDPEKAETDLKPLKSGSAGTYIENHGDYSSTTLTIGDVTYHGPDKEMLKEMLKMMESMMSINQKLIEQMEKLSK